MPTAMVTNEADIGIIAAANQTADINAPARPGDPVDDVREYIKGFIEAGNMPSHTRSMALTKMGELIFWLRAGYGKG